MGLCNYFQKTTSRWQYGAKHPSQESHVSIIKKESTLGHHEAPFFLCFYCIFLNTYTTMYITCL